MKVDRHYQRQYDSPGYVDFSDVRTVHKFARRVTLNLDVKVMMFFNVSKMVQGRAINGFVIRVSNIQHI